VSHVQSSALEAGSLGSAVVAIVLRPDNGVPHNSPAPEARILSSIAM
jgi:hypothetical protein